MSVINPFDFFLEPHAEKIPFTYEAWESHELKPYLFKLPATPLFQKYLDGISLEPTRTVDFLVALNARLQKDIAYTIRMEPGVQTPEETLKKRSGSCRDSAWLLVQMLRHLGLAARFVSGYLIQLTATSSRSTARPARRRISPTCTRGPKSICRAPAGSASIRRPACSPAKATFRSPARRSRRPPRRSAAAWTSAKPSSNTTCR